MSITARSTAGSPPDTSERTSPGRNDHCRAVRDRISDVGSEHPPLVLRRPADEMATPDPGGLIRIGRVRQVGEHPRPRTGHISPLLREADLPTDLHPHIDHPARHGEPVDGKLGPGGEHAPFVHRQVDLPIAASPALGTEEDRGVPPPPGVEYQRAADHMHGTAYSQFGQLGHGLVQFTWIQIRERRQISAVSGQRSLWKHHQVIVRAVLHHPDDLGEVLLDIPGDGNLGDSCTHDHERGR